jgi:protein gp37
MQPGEFRFYPNRVDAALSWKKPQRIFLGNLTDIFHEAAIGTKEGFMRLDDVFATADACPEHTFIYLTKRPQNICKFLFKSRRGAFSSNEWIGITIENQRRFDERFPRLKEIPAAVRFLHMEPLLGPVDISPALPHIQWVVVGGENGPGARPMNPDWVRSIRDQCVKAGIKFWFKGFGWADLLSDQGFKYSLKGCRAIDGREWNELPTA